MSKRKVSSKRANLNSRTSMKQKVIPKSPSKITLIYISVLYVSIKEKCDISRIEPSLGKMLFIYIKGKLISEITCKINMKGPSEH